MIITVTNDIQPDDRAPRALTAVSTTTHPMATGMTKRGPASAGLTQDKADAAAIATADCAAQFDTQNAHATMNAGMRPSRVSMLA